MLIPKLQCKPAVFAADDDGSSSFGGSLDVGEENLHLFAIIDTDDESFPYRDFPMRFLPLLYPLRFGGAIQYGFDELGNFKLIHQTKRHPKAKPMVDEEEFPLIIGTFKRIHYDAARALAMHELFFEYPLSDPDRRYIDDLDFGGSFRMGKTLFERQPGTRICQNPACTEYGQRTSKKTFVIIPCSRKLAAERYWGKYPQDVEIQFGFCDYCDTIRAENACT